MKKLILALVLLLGGAVSAFGQSTTVSGTVTDAGSQAWAGGTYKFTFTPNSQFPTGPYTWTGGALNQVISGVLDGSGAYSVSIPSNTAISPQGSKWILQVTPNATSSSFSTPPTTITGGTQTLNVTPPAIVVVATVVSRAYADAEVSAGAIVGSEYFNVTTSLVRVCTAVTGQSCTTWANVGSGAGGGITGSGVANQVAFFTAPTVIGGNANLTFDPTTGSFNAQGTGAFQGLSSGPALNNFVSVTPTAISLAANESGATGTFSSDGTFSINSATGNVAISAIAGLINFGSGAAAHLTDAGALTVTSCTGCGGSSGTVTNIATQGPLFGGPITTTGTIGIGFPDRSVAGTTDTILTADRGGRVVYTNTGAVAVSLPTQGSAGFTNSFYYETANESVGGVVTITPATGTINGAATLVLLTGQSCKVGPNSTGVSYQAECSESQITAGSGITLTRSVHGLSIASSGGISGLTTNTIPKATSATTIGNSSVTDDGTTVTVGINFAVTGTTTFSGNTFNLGTAAQANASQMNIHGGNSNAKPGNLSLLNNADAVSVNISASNTAGRAMMGSGVLTTDTPSTYILTAASTDTVTNKTFGVSTFSGAGAASTASVNFTGTMFTGGSTTTTFPNVYLNYGAAPTTWNVNGTALGINLPNATTSMAIDVHKNGGTSLFSVDNGGAVTGAGSATFAGVTSTASSIVAAASAFVVLGRSKIVSSVDGKMQALANAGGGNMWQSSGFQSTGTKFTASGCSNTTTVGGATVGSFASGTTGACTVTITMGDTMTATNGWACFAADTTTPANLYQETTGGSTTTAVLTGTTVSGDVIRFGCAAY